MESTIATLSTALLAATTLSAQGVQAGERPSPRAAWREFLAAHGPDWRVAWNPAAGTPEAIWGPGLRLLAREIRSLAQARGHAERTLDRFGTLLGRGPSRFAEVVGAKVARVYVFVYRQRYQGLEVIDGRADVRIHDNGVVSLFGSQAFPIPADLAITPGITVNAARKATLTALGLSAVELGRRRADDRLVIWADVNRTGSPVRLAWEIHVDHPTGQLAGRSYVDARNGAHLQYRSSILPCCGRICGREPAAKPAAPAASPGFAVRVIPGTPGTADGPVTGTVMAWTNTSLDPNAPLMNVPVANLAVGSTFTDASGNFYLPSGVTVTIRFQGTYCGGVTASQGTTYAQTLSLSGLGNTIQIFASNAVEFDRAQSTAYYFVNQSMEFTRGILGNLSNLTTLDGVTAQVNLSTPVCSPYYLNNTTNFSASSTNCWNTAYASVVQHEWGHGLDEVFNGISGHEMQEGLADTMAILQNDDPIIGTGFYKNQTPTYLRTATNTAKYPNGNVTHQLGETWMGLAWDLRQSLGLAATRVLFVGAFVADPRTQPQAAREIALLDDDDGNLDNGTPNCATLIAALNSRQIPNPIAGCPGHVGFSYYGTGCGPIMYNVGDPKINQSYSMRLHKAKPFQVAKLGIGLSDTVWGSILLPFELTAAGAPGCFLGASREDEILVLIDEYGFTTVNIQVPNNANLIGTDIFHQFVEEDELAKIRVSSSAKATIQ